MNSSFISYLEGNSSYLNLYSECEIIDYYDSNENNHIYYFLRNECNISSLYQNEFFESKNYIFPNFNLEIYYLNGELEYFTFKYDLRRITFTYIFMIPFGSSDSQFVYLKEKTNLIEKISYYDNNGKLKAEIKPINKFLNLSDYPLINIISFNKLNG